MKKNHKNAINGMQLAIQKLYQRNFNQKRSLNHKTRFCHFSNTLPPSFVIPTQIKPKSLKILKKIPKISKIPKNLKKIFKKNKIPKIS